MTDLSDDEIRLACADYMRLRTPCERYTSFDYCFNHFRSYLESNRLEELTTGPHLELACLQVGFFLASWGMFRNSPLLQKSSKFYEPLIKALVDAPSEIWHLDVAYYSDETWAAVEEVKKQIEKALRPVSVTKVLLTKILLGVFGCTPAFDDRFTRGSGLTHFNKASFLDLRGFYCRHESVIEELRDRTIGFDPSTQAMPRYTQAKIVDMIFFVKGRRLSASVDLNQS